MTSTTGTNSTDTPTVDLRDPGELLAALPHLLGFEPHDSLVLVSHRGRARTRIGNIVRADLPPPGGERTLARQMVEPLAHHASAVTVAVVGGRRPDGAKGPPATSVVDAVGEVFDSRAVPVPHALWVPEIRAGAPWRCYEEGCCVGHLPDPRSTVLAAVTAHAGLVTHTSRSDLERQLDPVAEDVLDRRAAMLARRATSDRVGDAAGGVESEAAVRRGRAAVRTVLARAWEGPLTLSDTEVVELAYALTMPRMRDACLTTALPVGSTRAIAAERLWLELTRHTPAPERAEPATLLAYSAYVRGEGALAGMALSAARAANSDHLLSQLLSQALEHGLPPETLAGLARTGDSEPLWDAPAELDRAELGTGDTVGDSSTRRRPPATTTGADG